MSSINRRGLFASLEDALSTDTVPGETEAVVLDAVQGDQDMREKAGELIDAQVQLEESVDAEGDLNVVADNLRESVDAGTGISEDAAAATEIAVESIMKRMGVHGYGKVIVASTESFGGSNTRLYATKASLEGVWDTIKEFWKKFKEQVARLFNQIKDFFAKFFDNAEKTKKAAEALKAEVRELGSKKAKETELKSSVSKAFSEKGKADAGTVSKILGNHSTLLDNAGAATSNFEQVLNKIAGLKLNSDKVTVARATAGELTKFAGAAGIVKGLTTDVPEKDEVKEDSAAKTKTTVKYAGPLFGNRVVAQEVVESTDPEDGSVKLSIGLKESSSKPAEKAVVLKDGEMASTLDAVIKLCEKVVAYKKEQSKTEAIGKDLSKAADLIVKALDTQNSTGEDTRSKELKTAVSNIKSACTSIQAVTLRLTTLAPSTAVSAGNAANQYVRESLAQYKADK